MSSIMLVFVLVHIDQVLLWHVYLNHPDQEKLMILEFNVRKRTSSVPRNKQAHPRLYFPQSLLKTGR